MRPAHPVKLARDSGDQHLAAGHLVEFQTLGRLLTDFYQVGKQFAGMIGLELFGYLFPEQPASKIEGVKGYVRYRDATVPAGYVMEIKIAPGRRQPVAPLAVPQPNQIFEAGQHFRFDIELKRLVFSSIGFFPNRHSPKTPSPASRLRLASYRAECQSPRSPRMHCINRHADRSITGPGTALGRRTAWHWRCRGYIGSVTSYHVSRSYHQLRTNT